MKKAGNKTEAQLRDLQREHAWGCVHATMEALQIRESMGTSQAGFNWAALARAAYHAGAAKIIQEILF